MRPAPAAALALLLLLDGAGAAGEADPEAGACASEECLAGGGAREEEAALLQVSRRPVVEANGWLQASKPPEDLLLRSSAAGSAAQAPGRSCPARDVPTKSQIAGFAKYLGGKNNVAWWNTPQPSYDYLQGVRSQLTPIKFPSAVSQSVRDVHQWSSGAARDIVQKMYEVTKARDTFSSVPEFAKGIFWMKGNGVPEVLTVLQVGTWIPEENALIVPMTPFNWAWPLSRPRNPPAYGTLYTNMPQSAYQSGLSLTVDALSFSYKFSSCPPDAQYCRDTSPSHDKAYAYMQVHPRGNIKRCLNLWDGRAYPDNATGGGQTGKFTLQAFKDNTTSWKRTCEWGSGGCSLMDFGSYDLVKVLDGSGQPVQPWYDQFMSFIGDVKLGVWSGFVNQTQEAFAIQQFVQATQAS